MKLWSALESLGPWGCNFENGCQMPPSSCIFSLLAVNCWAFLSIATLWNGRLPQREAFLISHFLLFLSLPLSPSAHPASTLPINSTTRVLPSCALGLTSQSPLRIFGSQFCKTFSNARRVDVCMISCALPICGKYHFRIKL